MLMIPIKNGDKKMRSYSFLYLIFVALINQNKYWFSSLAKIAFIALTIANQIFSQNTNYILYNTSNSGLPVNWVHSFAIDRTNNIWIGTYWNGLVKYDGNTRSTYSLCGPDFVTAIAVDRDNNLWVGACDLYKFDGNNWITYSLPSGCGINEIIIDENNIKWIGDICGHLIMFDDTSWTVFNTYANWKPPNFNHISIAIDSSGVIWIGSSQGGLERYDGTEWSIVDTILSVRSIAVDSSNNKWLGTFYSGLVKYNDSDFVFYTPSNSGNPDYFINVVKIDKHNNIWSGGYLTGLTKYDGQVWRNINTSNSCLTSDHIFCLAFDDSENIWIGAYTPYDSLYGGLAVYNENGISDLRFDNELLPEVLILEQNYPNPFNSSTNIRYIVHKISKLQIKIFDILGNEIETLVNDEKYPGEYEYIWNPQSISSGIYILQLKTESYVQSKKMVYLK